jgi:hypothetical protein
VANTQIIAEQIITPTVIKINFNLIEIQKCIIFIGTIEFSDLLFLWKEEKRLGLRCENPFDWIWENGPNH